MIEWLRSRLSHWLRIPPEPEPPLGAPGSLRTFRAGRNYLRLRIAAWLLGQVGALVGLLFSFSFLRSLADDIGGARAAHVQPAETSPPMPDGEAGRAGDEPAGRGGWRGSSAEWVASQGPHWVVPMLLAIEILGAIGFIVQIPLTLLAVRFEWELRWYMVTDRSLRIRSGLWTVSESTMSFANVQQVEVLQGPLERLLGIANVRVQSAGGGSSAPHQGKPNAESMHTGVFRGVENAREIRDLIVDRLRRFREAGLGDPDDVTHFTAEKAADTGLLHDPVAAAREVLEEARHLRTALTRGTA